MSDTPEVNDQAAEAMDPTEVLDPSAAIRYQALGKTDSGGDIFVFEQKSLTFMGKMDFFSVMGRALDKAMSGPDGLSIADLWSVPEIGEDGITLEDFKGEDVFVRGVAKIVSYAPEVLSELFCVALAVPRGLRKSAKELMELPVDEGGLSDADGVAIMTTFVDQNWEVIKDFFSGQLKAVVDKIGEKTKAPASRSSKRSKATRPSTEKQSKS